MSNEKVREVFEAWLTRFAAEANYSYPLCLLKRDIDSYATTWVDSAWLGWQASRAAIEVELSEPYAVIGDYAACGGGRSVFDVEYAEKITDRMCKKIPVYDRAQLEAAGLKVKP